MKNSLSQILSTAAEKLKQTVTNLIEYLHEVYTHYDNKINHGMIFELKELEVVVFRPTIETLEKLPLEGVYLNVIYV